MEFRILGKTGFRISSISFGAWAAGGDFGQVTDDASLATMKAAVDAGINFFDTADVYGDGRSEQVLARLKKEVPEVIIATKAGRRLSPHTADGYDLEHLEPFVDRSLKNLDVEALDLLQLHCPPTEVYYRSDAFEALDELVRRGKVRHYGVSIEKCEEGLKAIEMNNVATVQVIYNLLRPRPAELLFEQTQKRNIGVLARVPLASGLLSGKMRSNRDFEEGDHRKYNREGQAFDVGETFSGVDFETGIAIADELAARLPEGVTLAQAALRWILMHPAVTCAIPGAKSPAQVHDNVASAALPPLDDDFLQLARRLYDERVRASVHHRW